jgi:hypothetical protein
MSAGVKVLPTTSAIAQKARAVFNYPYPVRYLAKHLQDAALMGCVKTVTSCRSSARNRVTTALCFGNDSHVDGMIRHAVQRYTALTA